MAETGAEMNEETRAEGGQPPPEPRIRWRKRDAGQAADPGGEASESGGEGWAPAADAQPQLVVEQAKYDELAGKLARVQADFVNYKRRSEQELEQQARFATKLLMEELLPVLDNFDRALATLPDAVRALPWTDGLLLVDRGLRGTLEKQGLHPIEAVGTRFDPMLHEAIMQEESTEHADDEVIAELRRGYMLHDRVIRPTLVKVANNVSGAGAAKQATEE